MKGKINLILWTILIVLLLTGCKAHKKPITLATYTYATNDRIDNMKLLSADLEIRLQRKVDIKSYPDVKSFISAIKSNEIDIALINTLGYLILSFDNKHMLPIANMHIKKDAIDNYKTVFLTNNDSISDYSLLKDKPESLRMMFANEGSTSGNLIPRLFLSSINISSPESQFMEVKYGGNHTATFEKLVNGETDLCAIGSNEYYKQIQANPTLGNKVRLLWVSEEIPLGPVLINKQLPVMEKEIISNLFLNLHSENLEAFEYIKNGWSEAEQADKFQSITDEYYNSFREVDGSKTSLSEILEMFED